MKAMLIAILLNAAPSEQAIVALQKGQSFTAPYSGAYVPDLRAAQIKQICEQHRIEAALAKEELKNAQIPKYFWIVLGLSVTVGFVVGWSVR